MARRKNLKIQLHQRLNELLRIGQSRHEEKLKHGQNKVETIHSVSTAENYRQVTNQFANWLREERHDVWNTKDINAISDDVAKEYLQERQGEGLSAYTLSRDMAGINKVLDKSLTKANCGIKKRSYKDIERSRRNTNSKLSPAIKQNNREQIAMVKATGLRRHELMKLEKNNIYYDLKGEPIKLVGIVGKGGKIRDCKILKEHQKEIKEILSNKTQNGRIFDFYNKNIDNHAFRREYAKNLYNQLEKEFKEERKFLGKKIQIWHKEVLKKVSESLGHNRIDVAIYHYLK